MLKFLVFYYHKYDLINNLWNQKEGTKDKFQISLENMNYLNYISKQVCGKKYLNFLND